MLPQRFLPAVTIVLVAGLTLGALDHTRARPMAGPFESGPELPAPVAEAVDAAEAAVAPDPAIAYGMNGLYIQEVADPDETNLAYGQVWIGKWASNPAKFAKFESDVETIHDKGLTPVVEWWYFGDEISTRAVTKGLPDGRNVDNWNRLGVQMAKATCRATDGGDAIIVVETEFNKGGVGRMESFDGKLAHHVKLIKKACPSATVVIGFGLWGLDDWHRFDRAAAAADGVGYQAMRSLSKDTRAEYLAAPAEVERAAKHLKALFGKPIYLHDIALSSYGKGGAKLQAQVLDGILDRRESLEESGVVLVQYRSVRDTPSMAKNNYYAQGEAHWGLLTKKGDPKPAHGVWVAAVA